MSLGPHKNSRCTALAINVTIPEVLRWTDTRRGEEFTLSTLDVRLLPDGHLAAKACGAAARRWPRHLRLIPRTEQTRTDSPRGRGRQPSRRV